MWMQRMNLWTPDQLELAQRFHPARGPRTMMVCHETGTGKTLASLAVAMRFLSVDHPSVIVICPSAWQHTPFREALSTISALLPAGRETILRSQFAFYTHHQIAQLFKTTSAADLHRTFLHKLWIVDEAHHWLTGAYLDPGSPWNTFMDVLEALPSVRALFMTATPVRDRWDEFASLLRCLLLDSTVTAEMLHEASGECVHLRALDGPDGFVERVRRGRLHDGVVIKSSRSRDVLHWLRTNVAPRLSWRTLGGSRAKHFEASTPQVRFAFTRGYDGTVSTGPTTSEHVSRVGFQYVRVTCGDRQTLAYRRLLLERGKDKDDVAHAHLLSSLLWVYPDGQSGMEGFRAWSPSAKAPLTLSEWSPSGFHNVRWALRDLNPNSCVDADADAWWDELAQCSAKFAKVLRSIEQSASAGLRSMVYFPHVQAAGVMLFCWLLRRLGWNEWRAQQKENKATSNKFDYAWLTSSNSDQLLDILRAFNDPQSTVRVIVCGPVASESLTLLRVHALYYMAPHWNELEFRQVLGRAVRRFSHRHEPDLTRRLVTVFRMLARPRPNLAETLVSACAWPHLSLDEYIAQVAVGKTGGFDALMDVIRYAPEADRSSLSRTEPADIGSDFDDDDDDDDDVIRFGPDGFQRKTFDPDLDVESHAPSLPTPTEIDIAVNRSPGSLSGMGMRWAHMVSSGPSCCPGHVVEWVLGAREAKTLPPIWQQIVQSSSSAETVEDQWCAWHLDRLPLLSKSQSISAITRADGDIQRKHVQNVLKKVSPAPRLEAAWRTCARRLPRMNHFLYAGVVHDTGCNGWDDCRTTEALPRVGADDRAVPPAWLRWWKSVLSRGLLRTLLVWDMTKTDSQNLKSRQLTRGRVALTFSIDELRGFCVEAGGGAEVVAHWALRLERLSLGTVREKWILCWIALVAHSEIVDLDFGPDFDQDLLADWSVLRSATFKVTDGERMPSS